MLHEYTEAPGTGLGWCVVCGRFLADCTGVRPWQGFQAAMNPIKPACYWYSADAAPVPFDPVVQSGLFYRAAWRDEAQRKFYAGWDAMDLALERMAHHRRVAIAAQEVGELEDWWQL